MNTRRWVFIFLILILAGCREVTPTATQYPSPSPSVIATSSPTVSPSPTPLPDAETAVKAYLDAWGLDDYASMYTLLTASSHDTINQEDFINRYRDAMAEAAIDSVEYEILSSLESDTISAQVSYEIKLHSVLVG
ncbi:MAG: NTF2-like N-terminal transpeptidase domain-containing protein, partial [Chloroflexota bacterium]|nr:NTF2-like N-terminal transpeptidase domain-containing protein [Chloroflexota bacterium]